MKILIGAISFNTRIFTNIFLQTVVPAIREAKRDNPNTQFKLVVADNGSNDGTVDLIKGFKIDKSLADYECFASPINEGIGSGWNQLIKAGFDDNGNPLFDYYVICNNDILLTKNALKNFVKCLAQDTKKEYGWISMFANDYKEPEKTGVIETVQLENIYWRVRPSADTVKNEKQMFELIDYSYSPWGGIDAFNDMLIEKYGIALKEMHPKAIAFALSKECIKKVGMFEEYAAPIALHEDSDYDERIKRYGGFKFGAAYGSYVHHFSMMTRTRPEIEVPWRTKREQNFVEKWTILSKEITKLPDSFGMKLEICGDRATRLDPGWYHLSSDKSIGHIEFLHPKDAPLPVGDNTLSEIYCPYMYEDFGKDQILPLLLDWNKKLKLNGLLSMRVSNYNKRFLNQGPVDVTIKMLQETLTNAGYGSIQIVVPNLESNSSPNEYHLVISCRKE
jgi:GT2 family glycosyltransferase